MADADYLCCMLDDGETLITSIIACDCSAAAGSVDGDAADVEQVRAVLVRVRSRLPGCDPRPLGILLQRVHSAQV